MKKLFIAISFLLLAAGLCFFEQYTVEASYKTTSMYIDSAISQLDGGDYASAAQSCRELAEYWDKKYPIMSAMIDHGALEDADMTVGSLYDLAVKKSDNLEDELITAKNQMKSIRDGQRVTFGNVF